MPITISGSTGIAGVDGTASSPAVRGADTNTGVFYPAVDQVAIATGGVQRLLVDASGIVTTGVGALYPLVSGTAVASTSGTSIDFTSIPSWVKRITIMFNGVSTNGTSIKLVQIGAGSVTTSGYLSSSTTTGTTSATSATAVGYNFGTNSTADAINGIMTIASFGSNVWVSSHAAYANSTPQGVFGGGTVTLSGTLDRVRITTVGGTDAFDAGSINILYE
jgi:hypothetical protein